VVKKGMFLKTQVAVKVLRNLPEFTDQEELGMFYKEITMLMYIQEPMFSVSECVGRMVRHLFGVLLTHALLRWI
jgi:hypothetical protein